MPSFLKKDSGNIRIDRQPFVLDIFRQVCLPLIDTDIKRHSASLPHIARNYT